MRQRSARLAPIAGAGLLLAIAATGCAIRVYTDFDAESEFQRMQRFAWLEPPLREEPRPEGSALDPFNRNTLLDKRVRQAVEASLTARGYRRAENGPADFQLRYEVVSREVIRQAPVHVGGGYGHRRYGAGVAYAGTTSYREGTLILDVIDPATGTIAWRGWAASRTRGGHIDAERLSRTVDAILAKFPPESAGSDDGA